ncbi:MAG: Smr/MutS family protein, partial [Thermoanaerobaculia bacterium]
VAVGMEVRVASLGTSGRLLALDAGRGEAEVEVKGKRLKVAAAALSPAPAGRAVPVRTAALASNRAATPPAPSSGVVATAEVVLVGQRVDEALPVVEKAINDALLSGKAALRLVHGHGTGRLAAAVREFLQTHPGVASYRWGDAREGGQAVTIARLDV